MESGGGVRAGGWSAFPHKLPWAFERVWGERMSLSLGQCWLICMPSAGRWSWRVGDALAGDSYVDMGIWDNGNLVRARQSNDIHIVRKTYLLDV